MVTKKYHILYKTTNIINQKYYIGVHSTNKLEDGYLGKGVYSNYDINKIKGTGVIKAFKKYGFNNFKREILFIFNNVEEAYKKEEEIVNDLFIKNKKTYNLALGGKTSGKAPMTLSQKNKLINIHSKEYILVDTLENKVYEIKNLNKWLLENKPELIKKNNNNLKNKYIKLIHITKTKLNQNRYFLCYKKDWTGEIKLQEIKKRNNNNIRKIKNDKIPSKFFNKEGDEIIINNLFQWCLENKFCYSSMLKVKKGIKNIYKGYTNSLENHKKYITYLKLNEKIIKIFNIKEYCRQNKLDSKSIFGVKNKKINNYKGYTLYEK